MSRPHYEDMIESYAVMAGQMHPVTGARMKGRQWQGFAYPRNNSKGHAPAPYDAEREAANLAVEVARYPRVGIEPGGRLYQLLATKGVTRSLRRLVLATVQAKDTPRRARMNRRAGRQLRRLGVA